MANHNSTNTKAGAWNAKYATPTGRSTNTHDAVIAQHLADADSIQAGQDTAQVQATQDGKSRRNADSETGLTERQRLRQRGRAWVAGLVAGGTALTAFAAPGIINAANAPTVAAANANADAAKAEAGVKTATVKTGGKTVICSTVLYQKDENGNITAVRLPADDSGGRVTGDQIGQYTDGSGRIVVEDNRDFLKIEVPVDATGKPIGPVPEGCGLDSPKG